MKKQYKNILVFMLLGFMGCISINMFACDYPTNRHSRRVHSLSSREFEKRIREIRVMQKHGLSFAESALLYHIKKSHPGPPDKLSQIRKDTLKEKLIHTKIVLEKLVIVGAPEYNKDGNPTPYLLMLRVWGAESKSDAIKKILEITKSLIKKEYRKKKK